MSFIWNRTAVAAVALVVSCSGNGRLATDVPVQTGMASYYSSSLDGRRTASGEIYDETRLTAAHRTIPFGTRVRVTNLSNKRSVIVVINDRGPFVEGRIIDLSRRAARELDFLREGVTRVSIERL